MTAVFGGAFDPPTLAHEAIVRTMAETDVDEVMVVPCLGHPFGKDMAPFHDRVAMCESAFGGIKKASVSAIAEEVTSDKTIDLLEFLAGRKRIPIPVIGLDEACQICKWHRWQDLLRLYRFVVVERLTATRGARELELFYWRTQHVYLSPDPPIPPTSSTDARRNIGYLGDAAMSGRWGGIDEMYAAELSGLMSRPPFDVAVARGLYGCQRPR